MEWKQESTGVLGAVVLRYCSGCIELNIDKALAVVVPRHKPDGGGIQVFRDFPIDYRPTPLNVLLKVVIGEFYFTHSFSLSKKVGAPVSPRLVTYAP